MPIFKTSILLLLLICICQQATAQKSASKKHEFSVYWGYNRSTYSTSNLHLTGNGYDITVHKIIAHDRPTAFSAYNYFNIFRITIPQFNGKFTYIYKHKWMFGIGTDHMKYVMDPNQIANVDGTVTNAVQYIYNGNYQNTPVKLTDDFLSFEHTDGLNYIHTDARRMWQIVGHKQISLDVNVGAGIGVLLPKTNAVVLGNQRHDDYHLSGFGLNTVAGFRLLLYKRFFIASEAKLGYINMPSIRTTNNNTDNASQQINFAQINFGVGYNFFIKTNNK